MIYNALEYVAQELDRYLMRKFQLVEQKAILGSILNETGSVPEGNRDKVLITLVNMEQDNNYQYIDFKKSSGPNNYQLNYPFNFNMDILVTSLFSDYKESLKFLSETIYFFQSKSLFSHENSPGLTPNIKQLSFEVIKLSYQEAHSLWTALGAKYMPSVLFKVRMLSFQSDEVQKLNTTVKSVEPILNTE